MSDKSVANQDIYYSTGMTVLDQRLGGSEDENRRGIPGGSLILIQNPPQTNLGTLFAQKVLINLLDSRPNSKVYYMHSSRPQNVVMNEFKAYKWNIEKYGDRFEFVDMWHITSAHVASSSKIGKIDIRRKTYLKQAFARMLMVHNTDNLTCFSIVDNLLWLKEDDFDTQSAQLLDFFKELIDFVVEMGGIHFLILPKGILTDTAEKLIISVVNGIVEFSREIIGNKNQDQLSIIKMMGVTYVSDILDISPDPIVGLRVESTSKL